MAWDERVIQGWLLSVSLVLFVQLTCGLNDADLYYHYSHSTGLVKRDTSPVEVSFWNGEKHVLVRRDTDSDKNRSGSRDADKNETVSTTQSDVSEVPTTSNSSDISAGLVNTTDSTKPEAKVPEKKEKTGGDKSKPGLPPVKEKTIGDESNSTVPGTTEEPWQNPVDDVSNSTLQKEGVTQRKEDHHSYYNSTFLTNPSDSQKYWIELNNKSNVITHDLLSKSHRRAATVKLTFDFPFYGHQVRNITIATGGFLYTGDYVHSWLAATQYIAPLMANFDTSLRNDSVIKYYDNGTMFVVQWENVTLQDRSASGSFTFQVVLHSNGNIEFVYQNVPETVPLMRDDDHPVKVGLSDAYIIDKKIFFVRRKTIYEYDRVDFPKEDLRNWTAISLKALPTCLDMKDCSSCVSEGTTFECLWCPGADRCSTGMDRKRQEWLHTGCDKNYIKKKDDCPQVPLSLPTSETGSTTLVDTPSAHASIESTTVSYHSLPSSTEDGQSASPSFIPIRNNLSSLSTTPVAYTVTNQCPLGSSACPLVQGSPNTAMGTSGVIGILFFVGLIFGLGGWMFYAYRNPHTSSGQFLIRYRPSQWSWRRGEARYTAATIHM